MCCWDKLYFVLTKDPLKLAYKSKIKFMPHVPRASASQTGNLKVKSTIPNLGWIGMKHG